LLLTGVFCFRAIRRIAAILADILAVTEKPIILHASTVARLPQKVIGIVTCAALAMLFVSSAGAQMPSTSEAPASDNPLYWAYPVTPQNSAPKAADENKDLPIHLSGSIQTYTRAQTADPFNPPDWHPESHPPMPDIVAHGRNPDVAACALCHLPNGHGHPESANLTGLSVKYMSRQFADFKRGARVGSDPSFAPGTAMLRIAHATNEEISAAVKYYASLKREQWVRVVETTTVPKTHPEHFMRVPNDPTETEPLGQRIIETPEDVVHTELRDDRYGTVAYVPVGSIARGESLANSGGGGKTMRCAGCHGKGLKGAGDAPALAGRSPSYIVRQLNDMQRGTRAGAMSEPIKKPIAKLTLDDIIDLAAYIAILRP
jgi:cytochrome c553